MRSLRLKLTLAFLLVGLTGAILVAVIVGLRTRFEFDRFLAERDQNLVQLLSSYYVQNGGWEGLDHALLSPQANNSFDRGVIVLDAQKKVVFGSDRFAIGQPAPENASRNTLPVEVNGQTVGYVLFIPPPNRPNGGRPSSPDELFTNRVTLATGISAGIASVIALILGILLARTLTRPVRELTSATQVLARGQLNHRVAVHSNDEIGLLARSFNQMSEDLAHASHIRKQMTADLAHDLRTPLSILRGYTEGLQEGRLQGSPRLYTIMHGEVEHLQRLVEDLRVLSLADAGELSLNRRPIDPTALLERAYLAYIVQAEEQGVALHMASSGALPSVVVDTDRMSQVLNNLVSNALRYTTQGEINLVARAVDDHVQLLVRDTGSGIAPDDLPFIFDRFYRADKARQRTDSTTSGLGLAITKAIVEAHGATIHVESVLEQGTTFIITLPVTQSQPPQNEHEAIKPIVVPAHIG